jgi:uncharacterized protein (TIGR03067 family)
VEPTREEIVKREITAMQGDWIMISGERNGVTFPEKILKVGNRVSKGDWTSVSIDGSTILEAKFTIDPTKSPKTIDYTLTDSDHKGQKRLGIYEWDGDTLKFCVGPIGKDRPTSFEGKDGTGWTYVVWKRIKK